MDSLNFYFLFCSEIITFFGEVGEFSGITVECKSNKRMHNV